MSLDIPYFLCPECGSSEVEIVAGFGENGSARYTLKEGKSVARCVKESYCEIDIFNDGDADCTDCGWDGQVGALKVKDA